WLDVVARLAPGVSHAAAAKEIDAIVAGVAKEHADTNAHFSHAIVQPLFERVVGPTRAPLTALFAATGLVLLIACGNLANLLLARAQKRERELVTRSALGAAPARLGGQLVAETLVLTVVGAALGAVLAQLGLAAWLRGLDAPIARQAGIGLDWTVLAFGAFVALACGLGIGLVPAWRARRLDPARVLSRGGAPTAGSAHARLRAVLVVAQVALVCALGYASTLAVESLRRVLAVDSGVDTARVLTFNVRVDGPRYEESREARVAGQRAILDALRAIPGVVAVGGSKNAPIGQTGEGYEFTDKAHPDRPMRPDFGVQFVSHDYFRALGVPFERGRDFTGEEKPDGPVTIIVNRAFVERWYAGEDVVGKRLMLGDSEVEVVGVVADIRHGGLRKEALPAAYAPNNQVVRSSLTVSVRTNGPVPDLVARARDAVWSVDARLPITGMRWLDEELARMEAQPRLVASLLSAFALLSALIGGLGVFSLLAYVVGERRRELAVRLAIGAPPMRLLGVVVAQVARLAVAGVAIGLPLGIAAAQLLGTQLYDTRTIEPLLLGALGVATLALCALAAIAPGATALRTEPMQVLRQE
ncbi:MAG TPA: FtsX-like permease family protein, partial [Xanthomonadales bacterium]|nr:FtsX-like permease family protein [Xanthomonadales bacterium]